MEESTAQQKMEMKLRLKRKNSMCLDSQLDIIRSNDPQMAHLIEAELSFQRDSLRMIASENYASFPVLLAMGTCLSDKYAEGNSKSRFYGGCRNIDVIEELAENRLMSLFPGFDGCSVQPHSGSDANLLAYIVALKVCVEKPFLSELKVKTGKNYTINNLPDAHFEALQNVLRQQVLMGFSLRAGGHLTHGFRNNLSARLFRPVYFTINDKEEIDYDEVEALACEARPLVLVAGITSYPRHLNFARLRAIADACGSVLLADIAHIAGLVCTGHLKGEFCPLSYADIMTMTTHKTLRGPRGGAILAKGLFAEEIKNACPLMMGGPLPHVMAAKAIAFAEAQTQEFKEYIGQVIENARTLANTLQRHGVFLYTGGTSNHLLVADVKKTFNLSGSIAEQVLESIGIVSNRNMLPCDSGSNCSGIRFGTAAITSRGLGPSEVREIGDIICSVLRHTHHQNASWSLDQSVSQDVSHRVLRLCDLFPMPYEVPNSQTRANSKTHQEDH